MSPNETTKENESVASAPEQCWQFGSAVLDESAMILRVNGQAVDIERKSLEVMRHLLHHAGKLVTKDQLLESIWPGRIVTETVLTKCIHKLREALGDEQQTIIATVHGYGYRLDVSVRSEAASATAAQPEPIEAVIPVSSEQGALQGATATVPTRRPKVIAVAAGGLALLVLSAGVWKLNQVEREGTPSVAVLPFANLSENPTASDYFAGGVHESILTHLARVKDLKVISRTSVMEYKDKTRNLREIGQALGVANIVEGSVQRAGGRVRITAQLIEAANDSHLWAETYDRDIADVFAIQSEVAERIVAAVKATLTPEEKGRIELLPTENAEAYDLYLRATELQRLPSGNRETGFRIQTLLEQAISLDPGFALAHAALGRNHMELYWFGIDTTAHRRDQARVAAETALRLQPDLAEGHFALGQYFYHGFRDYERALKEFDEALSRAPNSSYVLMLIGAVQRRRGQWESSIASMNRAVELDPRNVNTAGELGYTYVWLRQYAKAASLIEKAVTLAPEDVEVRLRLASYQFLWKGDLNPLRKALAEVPPGVDPDQIVSGARITLALWEGRYAEAISLLTAFPRDGLVGKPHLEVPKDFYFGQAYTVLGDAAKARPYFRRARERLLAYMAQEPESISLAAAHAWLGLTQAYLGERAEALRNADRALELLPISRDAVDGPGVARIAAAIHMRLGDHDRALAELEQLLKTPAGPHAHILQRDPEWKPLWNDPRFQKLIAEHLPKQ